MPGPDPVTLGLQAAGMAANYFTGQGAANKSKQLMGLQRGYARRQLGQYDLYQPQYNAAMERYGQDIGMVPGGPQGYVNQTGVSPHQANRLGIDPNTQFQNPMAPGAENGYLLGPYAQQSYRLLRQGAEQDIQRQMQGQDQNLMFALGQQGIATGSQAAALGREHSDMLRGYSDYLRNLAINAGDKQQQQQQQYLGMLQGAMAPGAEGAGILGQQGGMYGAQAQNAFGAMGGIAQNYVQNQAMQNAMQALYGGGQQQASAYGGGNINPAIFGAQQPMDPQLAAYYQYLRQNENPALGYG
jgi:hypothetical protein